MCGVCTLRDTCLRALDFLVCGREPQTCRQNQPMQDFEKLADDHLLVLAHEWRRRAMHGEKDAGGAAHTLKVEIRRRVGNPASSQALLDTRPLEDRIRKPWWRIW